MMPFSENIMKRCAINPAAAMAFVFASCMVANAGTARSDVFEQVDSGNVEPMGDIPIEGWRPPETALGGSNEPSFATTSTLFQASTAAYLSQGSVIEDDPIAGPEAGEAGAETPFELVATNARYKAQLPKPRALSAELSNEQRKMRLLTIEVGARFASAPGVSRAALDRTSFMALFTTMIHRESNFNPRAVSPAGARGLGQLMPGTAKALGVCNVFSPRENLEGAATYLTSMLEQFGSPFMALAAYNAGPGAVIRHRGIPPYPETRQYIADIIHATGRNARSLTSAGAFVHQQVQTSESGGLPIAFEVSARSRTLSGNCAARSYTGLTLARN